MCTHVFPVHLTDNGFGGTALYNDMFAFNNKIVTGDWWDYAGLLRPATATSISGRSTR